MELFNLGEQFENAKKSYDETYKNVDIKLTENFKEEYQKYLTTKNETVHFLNFSVEITTGKLKKIFPNQWFYMAVYFIDYTVMLEKLKNELLRISKTIPKYNTQKFKDVIKELKSKGWDEVDNEFKVAVEANYSQDSINLSYIKKFLTDYSWWGGAKTIDRNDFIDSTIMEGLKVVNASHGYIADITKIYSTNKALKNEAKKLIEYLINKKKFEKISEFNRIVYGAPGTGKSYQLNKEVKDEEIFPKLVETKIKNKKLDNKSINYWVATCGEDNDYWDDFYDKSKFAIGWGGIEDLKQFSSLSNINEKLMEIYDYGENNRTINYFKYIKTSMKKGDIIIIRKGRKNIIEGYGVVTGDYEYDISMPEDFYHTISVEWKKKETITLDEYSRNLPWATISSANGELVSLLSKNKYIEKEIETENIKYEVVERVTFYDGYTHGQFVGTYKPVPEGDSITYKYIPGPFIKQLVESYKNPEHNFCLIIEEINRAKADKVFGNIFQLLDRDSDGKSEYHIAVSVDQETYLKKELEDEYNDTLEKLLNEGLYIPNNLYIWATMNSSDQGVYPMDSAFKRRWHFEHIGLDENEDQFGEEGKTFGLTYQKQSDAGEMENKIIPWNDFRKIINKNLLGNNVSEDRLLAPFFIKENNFQMKEEFFELDEEVFQNKILMYLFDDVLRHRKKTILFDENIESFSQLKTAWENGKVIFHSAVIEKLETKKLMEESIVENTSEEA